MVFIAFYRNGVNLNNVLLKGPDLLNSLLGVMFKFRQRNIAVTADIQGMFHRVETRPEVRIAQRFLLGGGEIRGGNREFEMVVMIFGAVSSPTSTIRHEKERCRIRTSLSRCIQGHHRDTLG
ncbi:hypothetical protein JTB14_011540 [Gonioctena quinquepunctata]|nr:hypothetical protein JTB14_011540 [Gonioctena quinquepunctata]